MYLHSVLQQSLEELLKHPQMEVTEAPVNSEPVATSQANADSLMSQATAVATSDVSTPTTTATATNTTDSQPTETVAEVATIQPVVVMIITLTLKRLIHLLKLKR